MDLSENKLGDGGIQALCAALPGNSTLLRLGLSGNHLGTRAAAHLADSLLVNHKIESLDLSHNQLDDRAGEFLGRALAENTGLKELFLSWNHFHSPGAVALARGLEVNPADGKGCSRLHPQSALLCGSPAASLVGSRSHGDRPSPPVPKAQVAWREGVGRGHLQLSLGGRDGEGPGVWGPTPCPPQANIFLKVLDVSYNGFGDPGAAALGVALRGNNVLEELDVSNNRISPAGALRLASGLRENRTLRTLVMARNPMRSEGSVRVLKSIQANARSSLEMLDFTDISVNKDFWELSEAVRGLFPRLRILHGGFPAPFRRDRSKLPDEAAA
ncbi:leucine-rich repeat-containing protein 74B isoform X2 [Tachyglossus aculeatus]|uniref:leucine-rich repeat-containing protein 74B isoform X2 n=1 Tax=Tachyglossus aculeatus TaxID=9261 RepID=UPI0018F68D12|nr:leucine-rich repeat-containing protein 74B isoform X2 [Tachyglossus aculeatus]